MKTIIDKIDWNKDLSGLIPAIIQDFSNDTVLMLGFMNKESLEKTLSTKKVWFYSRSKKRLWMKGETSNNVLEFVEAKIDCDRDSLLIKAKPTGPICHTGTASCFNEVVKTDVFSELFEVIKNRKEKMPKKSYTVSLFQSGLKEICAKVKEESEEAINAAKTETEKRLIEESADVLYHLFVLLVYKNISLEKLSAELKFRRTKY